MNLILTVFEIAAPVFLLAGIGFVWVKLGFEYRLQFVTRFAMTLAVPSLIFVALMQTEIPGGDLTRFTAATIVANIILAFVFWGVVRVLKLEQRTYLSPLIFGNTGNLGLPLCIFAFGQAGLGYAVIFLSVTALFSFTYGIYLVAGKGAFGQVIRQPMVWATLLGALFLWQGWETPLFLTNTLDLLGQMAVPMMLVTVGVAIARLTSRSLGQAVWLSFLKLLVCFILGWGVAVVFELDAIAFGVLVLQMCTPVAVTSYLLAERFEADADAVAGMVMVSTVLSVAALPAILAIVL
ncbi:MULTISPECIES: AEC family transporter [unclassified Ruegeria]|uniref:AEC family transporter n=1 Tax=unclassified Ruegeria TaxID=2625375 RepID=UPI001487C01B|nr:AEC family transporter [Ruegeria sp. HKCCD7296]NOD49172.1 AEC family transporter [Ruegeria sp. HKCCD5849]NOD51736.1 AEC family transporter [Ruegeria sp. HKCCD5851]NOD68722.1 AEC family transporter [Ruegeria sp. HKCCD7303]NOE34997.1 AEC family transporter [Ruegeria sp. HKCCD7318]NOE42709.1 AEC family transporter [Ruegeria sp. HKCCD7319]